MASFEEPVFVTTSAGSVEPDEFDETELTPEMLAQLLDPDAWAGVLGIYANSMRMAVALTDAEGRRLGICHNPQPVWLLARGRVPDGGECSFCLGPDPACSAVKDALNTGVVCTVRDAAGLAHVAAPLFFGKRRLGALIAGQVFDHYPQPLPLRRLARDMRISSQQIWEAALRQLPFGAATLSRYSDLLMALGQASVRQRYAILLAKKLKERTRALAKANEELERANENLKQFAYSASHDLQEPLRTVTIYSQLLESLYKGKMDAEADEILRYIVEESKRMGMLVSDILAFTRTATDSERPQVPVDSNAALDKVVAYLAGTIADQKAEVTHGDLPELHMQEVHLQQLLQNLIGNALKYRKLEETPKIHISAERRRDGFVVSVADNGIGIDPRYATQIFGIFKRLHTKDTYTGTGIGLAICKKIVERYSGKIWVESELGKGSTFRFELQTRAEAHE